MINVSIPKYCVNEVMYVLDVVLNDFLGIRYDVTIIEQPVIIIQTSGKEISINTSFFQQVSKGWLTKGLLDHVKLEVFNCQHLDINSHVGELPVFFGDPNVKNTDDNISIDFDIFGYIFFMLTRYEEAISQESDLHGRFPYENSVMYKYELTKRPTVNEYIEVFWYYLSNADSSLKRKLRTYRKLISCDVDHPFDKRNLTIKGACKRALANILKHKNIKFLVSDICHFLFNNCRRSNTFDRYLKNLEYIMDVNDKVGNVVCFNFIPLKTHKRFDANNRMDDLSIIKIIEHIRQRGHEVGFHPGYETSSSPIVFNDSAHLFWKVFLPRRKGQLKVGGRQHYLRFNILNSPAMWQNAGFDFDSSIGFPDNLGFRAGVCWDYPMYDLVNRVGLALRQVPLISMEGSVLKNHASKFRYSDDVLNEFNSLKELIKLYSGDYTLLWHNSYFNKKDDFRLYEALIK